jgi:hypothetical protein
MEKKEDYQRLEKALDDAFKGEVDVELIQKKS